MLLLAATRVLDDLAGQPAALAVERLERQEQRLEVGGSACRAEKISIKGCAGDACWQEAWWVEVLFRTRKKANKDPPKRFQVPL